MKPDKREYLRQYRLKNLERLKAYAKAKGYDREWSAANPERRAAIQRRAKQKNYAKNRATRLKYLAAKKEEIKKKHKEWLANNRERMNAVQWARRQERQKTDPNFRLKLVLSAATRRAIKKGLKRPGPTLELIGGTIDQARAHIESQFQEGMSWDNHGLKGWHIDHIRPLASFNFLEPAQVRAALHYTNLQPLWAEQNLAKAAKIL